MWSLSLFITEIDSMFKIDFSLYKPYRKKSVVTEISFCLKLRVWLWKKALGCAPSDLQSQSRKSQQKIEKKIHEELKWCENSLSMTYYRWKNSTYFSHSCHTWVCHVALRLKYKEMHLFPVLLLHWGWFANFSTCTGSYSPLCCQRMSQMIIKNGEKLYTAEVR